MALATESAAGDSPRRHRPLLALSLAYLGLISAFMIWRGVSGSPDYLLLLLLPVAIASGRFWRFLGDWIPFIVIVLAYEAMRGVAPKTGISPHVADLANLESTLFAGHIPTAVLQAWLVQGPARGHRSPDRWNDRA